MFAGDGFWVVILGFTGLLGRHPHGRHALVTLLLGEPGTMQGGMFGAGELPEGFFAWDV